MKIVDRNYIVRHIESSNDTFDVWLFPILFIVVFALIFGMIYYMDPVGLSSMFESAEITTGGVVFMIAFPILIAAILLFVYARTLKETEQELFFQVKEDVILNKTMTLVKRRSHDSHLSRGGV